MPAAMRGESRAQAKPRAKTPASSKSAPRARKPGAAYAPGKLGAARGVGLSPWHALIAAAGVVTIALTVTMVTGHRGEKLSASMGSAVGGQLAAEPLPHGGVERRGAAQGLLQRTRVVVHGRKTVSGART